MRGGADGSCGGGGGVVEWGGVGYILIPWIAIYSECTRIPFCLFSCWITRTLNLTINNITIDQTQYLSKFLQKFYTHLKSTSDLSSLPTYALPNLSSFQRLKSLPRATLSTSFCWPAMEPICTRCWLRTFCLITEEPRGYQTDKLRSSIAT